MNNMKKALLMLTLALTCCAYAGTAQIEVSVRPPMPRYERPAPPSPRHVWIDEEWQPRGNTYVFAGGRWAEPPHRGGQWVPGHWKNTPHGTIWRPGHWR